jgi:hypothetical protein
MPGIAQNPLTRIVSRMCLFLGPLMLVLLAALAVAGPAQAGAPDAHTADGLAILTQGAASPEVNSSNELAQQTPTEPPSEPARETPPAEPSSEPAQEPPPAEPSSEPAQEPPPAEPPSEPVKETPPPEPPSEPAKETPPPEPAQETPPSEPPNQPAPEVPPVPAEPITKPVSSETIGETGPKVSPAEAGLEENSKGTPSPPGSQGLTMADATVGEAPPPAPDSAAIATPSSSALSPMSAPVKLPPAPVAAAADDDTGVPSAMTPAQVTSALNCELSALRGRVSDSCAIGWLGSQQLLSQSSGGFPTEATSLTAPGGPAGGDRDRSGVETPPLSPAPGPAPSGASSGSAAGGAGVAPSGVFTLSGLLHLPAPRAMRRLRLSSQPWLTACFVLIPERPG